jgi:hypothetical protein
MPEKSHDCITFERWRVDETGTVQIELVNEYFDDVSEYLNASFTRHRNLGQQPSFSEVVSAVEAFGGQILSIQWQGNRWEWRGLGLTLTNTSS